MAMTLHTISPAKGSRKGKKRVGRGLSSKGTTAGRGTKGQRARSGGKGGLKMKGLRQTLLRVPKSRGFKSQALQPSVVQLDQLNDVDLKIVSPKTLKAAGLVEVTRAGVKILSRGDIKKAVQVKGCKVSAAAKAKIEKAGGTVS